MKARLVNGGVYSHLCISNQRSHLGRLISCSNATPCARTRVLCAGLFEILPASLSDTTLEYTALEPLFNGIGPPSDLALDYLIWARESILTPLQSLPLEVQDTIVRFVSAGTVAAAKVGCLLGLRSPFLWKDGPLHIKLEETYTQRTPWSPVESQVWFDRHRNGNLQIGAGASSCIQTIV